MNNLPRIAWDGQANPKTIDMPSLMYAMRRADTDGLLLDSCTFDELTAENDGIMTLDALVVMAARLEPRMEILSRLMSGVGELKVVNMQTSNPLRKNGAVHVAVMWELSDGQTVSVWFHNPDTTPAKLTPMDDLVSWKWLLNKRDVTIVAAPERGTDLSPREVARRVMRLAEKNSAAFQKANANKSEKVRLIAELETANGAKRVELESLLKQLEVAQFEADTAPKVSQDDSYLPEGWTQSPSGKLATKREGDDGGIVDKAIKSGEWFVVANNKAANEKLKDATFKTRREAFDALAAALAEVTPAATDADEKEQGAATALSLHEILIGSGWAETHNSADQRVGMKGRAGYSMFPLPSGNGEWSIAMFIQDHGNSGITDIDKIKDVNPKFKQFPSKKSIIIPVEASENDLTEIATAVNEVGIRLNSSDSIKWDDFVSQNPAVQPSVDALDAAAKTGGASIEWGFFEDAGLALDSVINEIDFLGRMRDAATFDSATDTKQAAGIALSVDGEYLMVKRGQGDSVGTWAFPAGMVEAGESPEVGARRELMEECAVAAPDSLKLINTDDSQDGLVFTTFAGTMDTKPDAVINDESSEFGWFALDSLPSPLHPAIERDIEALTELLQQDDFDTGVEWDAVPEFDSTISTTDFLKILDESIGRRIPNKELSELGFDLCLYDGHYELLGRLKSNKDVVNVKYKGKTRFSKEEVDEVVSLLVSKKTDGITLDGVGASVDDAGNELMLDGAVLDGDFRGHPFRGNQYKHTSQESGSAVHASMKAKHAELKGDKKTAKQAHKAAHYAHMAASIGAKGKAKGYHTKMANFHATKAI